MNRRTRVMRLLLATLGFLVLLAGCGARNTEAEFNLINKSDSGVCFARSPSDATRGICDPIDPHTTKTWSTMCGSGVNTKLILVTMVLTAGPGGPTIYDKRATCEAWMDAGTDIVVEQAADQLVVKDSSPQTQ
jgi:hypothetical protein